MISGVMYKFKILLIWTLFVGSLSAIDIDYPAVRDLRLHLEARTANYTIDGIPVRVVVFEDTKESESFFAPGLPGFFLISDSEQASLSMRGRFPDTVFFDWYALPLGSVLASLNTSTLESYALGLKQSVEEAGDWELEILNSDNQYKFDYGSVTVRPPNREPYELAKKPRVPPLGCSEYFLVEYKVSEVFEAGKKPSAQPKQYFYRDYIFNAQGYFMIMRVGTRGEDPQQFFSAADRFIRSIGVGDGSL
jgi:hypothetical protein